MGDSRFVITDNGILKEYHGNEEFLQIPDGVKVIGKGILGYSRGGNVRKLIIPEGVTEIQEGAFNTSKISEVILPSTLKKIGEWAFAACENLKNVTIPDGVMLIPAFAFSWSGLE